MKRLILTLVAMVAMVTIGYAQNYIVVNSEKIFKSIEAYNTAIIELDRLAEGYQLQVDAKFREVERKQSSHYRGANSRQGAGGHKVPGVDIWH